MKRQMLTEEKFGNIKTLIKHGLNRRDVSSLMGVSMSTVNRVAIYDSLQDYRKATSAWGKKPEPEKPAAEAPTPVTKPDVTRISDYQINRMLELLKQQNELLTGISAKLAYIVEQLA